MPRSMSPRQRRSPKRLPAIALRVPLRELRGLSLDAIAHYLSHPDPDERLPPLKGIDNGACLLELLRMQRIILLLDGLDELAISQEKLEDGLSELRKAVLDGGRVVVSARLGHLTSSRALAQTFPENEIARIQPMSEGPARDLLRKYGAPAKKADEIVHRLRSSPAQGIPLFLLMAYSVELSTPLEPVVLKSRTKVLAELLTLFCRRDEPRLGLSTEEQLTLLTLFAHWTSLLGELNSAQALEHLGLDPAEPAAKIVLNPHALLTKAANEAIRFRYPHFFHFFAAKALADDWSTLGFSSILEVLRGRRLDDETVEYMARLVTTEQLGAAWALSTERDDLSNAPLVRRNLLAVALAQVDDEATGASPTVRSTHLARVLGARRLEGVSLVGVTLQRFDLSGWKIVNVQGRGGSMVWCTNLAKCEYDDSILTLDSLEGTENPSAVDEKALIVKGCERLRRIIRPLRRKHDPSSLIDIMNLSECKDSPGWQVLQRHDFALQRKRGAGGERAWILVESGVRRLSAFAQVDADQSPQLLAGLLEREPALRHLLIALASLK